MSTEYNPIAEARARAFIADVEVRARIRAERHARVSVLMLQLGGSFERLRESVNRVTPAVRAFADTLNNGAHVAPAGETEMFRTDLTDYIVTAALLFALVATVFA